MRPFQLQFGGGQLRLYRGQTGRDRCDLFRGCRTRGLGAVPLRFEACDPVPLCRQISLSGIERGLQFSRGRGPTVERFLNRGQPRGKR